MGPVGDNASGGSMCLDGCALVTIDGQGPASKVDDTARADGQPRRVYRAAPQMEGAAGVALMGQRWIDPTQATDAVIGPSVVGGASCGSTTRAKAILTCALRRG